MCSLFFFFKQKTAYEMRISDWSSDVCSSDLVGSVAFDDAVENAITDASCVSRKKAIGDRRASTMSNNGKTMNICTPSAASTTPTNADSRRTEERRVGKEGVSTVRSRWAPDH